MKTKKKTQAKKTTTNKPIKKVKEPIGIKNASKQELQEMKEFCDRVNKDIPDIQEPLNKELITGILDSPRIEEIKKRDFISEVQQELINNYFDIDRVKQCYQLIQGIGSMANNRVMRITILNYS